MSEPQTRDTDTTEEEPQARTDEAITGTAPKTTGSQGAVGDCSVLQALSDHRLCETEHR